MTASIGGAVFDHVANVQYVEGDKAQLMFFFEPGAEPPNFDTDSIIGKFRIVVGSIDFGERDICCFGQHLKAGGFLSVRWEL